VQVGQIASPYIFNVFFQNYAYKALLTVLVGFEPTFQFELWNCGEDENKGIAPAAEGTIYDAFSQYPI
jgi:hypothetical protein